jgi:hypothetical protein
LQKDIHIRVGENLSYDMRGMHGNWQTLGDVAGWYEGDDYIVLDPDHNTYGKMPDNWSLATIVHETLHVEQGGFFWGASTKDSELKGYQVGVRTFMNVEGKTFSQLDVSMQDMYSSTSGWNYGQKVKNYLPGYWWGLRLLPPYSQP